MKFTIIMLLLSVLLACSSNMDKKDTKFKSAKPELIEANKMIFDTLNTSFPIQIGNDRGFVIIVGIKTFKNQKLTSSNFIISLNEIQNFSISKQINIGDLIDADQAVYLKDTIKSYNLDNAIIKNIEFNSVRTNTLHFNAILENPTEGKEIAGRFSLFYRTKKKGKVYGWYTDEVKEIL